MSHCPHCNNAKSEVLETRRYKDFENWTQRTRRCYNCNQTFKTVELSLGDLERVANGDDPNTQLHMMQGLRIRINDIDHLFFGPVVHDPDSKFNVQEIEDVGLVPMASVTDLLTRTQEGEKFYGEVQ